MPQYALLHETGPLDFHLSVNQRALEQWLLSSPSTKFSRTSKRSRIVKTYGS